MNISGIQTSEESSIWSTTTRVLTPAVRDRTAPVTADCDDAKFPLLMAAIIIIFVQYHQFVSLPSLKLTPVIVMDSSLIHGLVPE